MAKMEPDDGTEGVTNKRARAHPSSSSPMPDSPARGSPIIVLLGVVAVAAMALGLVVGFLIGLLV